MKESKVDTVTIVAGNVLTLFPLRRARPVLNLNINVNMKMQAPKLNISVPQKLRGRPSCVF